MCRNIRTLFNFEPVATAEEIQAASLQYVRKISGFNTPSKANEAAFYSAVDEVARVSHYWLRSLTKAGARSPETRLESMSSSAISSAVSSSSTAATFSSMLAAWPVPKMGTIISLRESTQASATWAPVAPHAAVEGTIVCL
jgi:hypothetical protein